MVWVVHCVVLQISVTIGMTSSKAASLPTETRSLLSKRAGKTSISFRGAFLLSASLCLSLCVYLCSTQAGCVLYLKADEEPFPFTSMKSDRVCRPDFVLIRNFPGNLHTDDYRNILIGIYVCCVRCVVFRFSLNLLLFFAYLCVCLCLCVVLRRFDVCQPACREQSSFDLYGPLQTAANRGNGQMPSQH